MNTRLKADIEEAIQTVFNSSSESDEPGWDHFIHPTLVVQMVNAAALVFDSAQDAQDYYEEEFQ